VWEVKVEYRMKYYWVGRDLQPTPDRRDAKKGIFKSELALIRRGLLGYDKQ